MIEGACLCGGITYRTSDEPLWCAHCHCSLCRRFAGAAFVTWTGIREETASINDDNGLLGWYSSSPGAQRGFCSQCGTSLFFRSEKWPGELHVATATISGDICLAPQGHVCYQDRVSWVEAADDLPRKDAI